MIQVIASSVFAEVKIIIPTVHEDHRGTFCETYTKRTMEGCAYLYDVFVQENLSVSHSGVLRGLHGDNRLAKLVHCVKGRIFDAVVDMREKSPTYRKWETFILSESNHKQVYVPPGFAHGFYALTDCVVAYKQTDYHDPASEFGVFWRDPSISIRWPNTLRYPKLSEKDAHIPLLVPMQGAYVQKIGVA